MKSKKPETKKKKKPGANKESFLTAKFNQISRSNKYSFILISSVCLLLYFQVVTFGLSYCDDHDIILTFFSRIKNFSSIISNFFHGYINTDYYRPIINLSFLFDAQFGGQAPGYYHFINILYHALFCCSIFILLNKLKFNRNTALLISLIYAVHPLFTNSVAWIVGRNDMIYGLFCVLSFIYLINFNESLKLKQLLLHLLFLFLSFLTKETALIFPAILFSYQVLIYNREKQEENGLPQNIFSNKKYNIPIFILLWSLLIGLYYLLRSSAELGTSIKKFGLDVFIFNLPTVPEFIAKAIIPVKLSVLSTFNQFNTILGIILIIVLIYATIKSKEKRWNYVLFGIIWFIIMTLPGMLVTIINVGDWNEYLETRAYLPMLGLAILFMEIIPKERLNFKKSGTIFYTIILLLVLSILTFAESRSYKNSTVFYQDAVKSNPGKSLFHVTLAQSYAREGRNNLAEDELKAAIELKPTYFKYYSKLADLYYQTNNFPDAIANFSKAIKFDSTQKTPYTLLAKSYYKQKNYPLAVKTWERIISKWENDTLSYLQLASTYLLLDNYDMAYKLTETILKKKFRTENLWENYAAAGNEKYFDKDYELALKLWQKAIEIDSTQKIPFENLCKYYFQIEKDFDKAKYYADEFLKRGGKFPEDKMKFFENYVPKRKVSF